MELQQLQPPFAGYLACRPEEIAHIYVSPGPIFEPSLASDASGHGMDLMFAAAGIGPGDLVLNTWSYHLVPAGLLFDQGARAVGATVIPGGTGASELQAEVILKLGVTALCRQHRVFRDADRAARGDGPSTCPAPGSCGTPSSAASSAIGPQNAGYLEQRYAINTWSCYGTADFGLDRVRAAGETPVITFTGIAMSRSAIPRPGRPFRAASPARSW